MTFNLRTAALLTAFASVSLAGCEPPIPEHNQYDVKITCGTLLKKEHVFQGVNVQEGLVYYTVLKFEVDKDRRLQPVFKEPFPRATCHMKAEKRKPEASPAKTQ